MPTALPRSFITHTAPVQRALSVAQTQWPGEKPSALLVHLAQVGAEAIEAQRRDRLRELELLAEEIDADYGNQYTETYLGEVRAGWH
jgi:hypothetical protein